MSPPFRVDAFGRATIEVAGPTSDRRVSLDPMRGGGRELGVVTRLPDPAPSRKTWRSTVRASGSLATPDSTRTNASLTAARPYRLCCELSKERTARRGEPSTLQPELRSTLEGEAFIYHRDGRLSRPRYEIPPKSPSSSPPAPRCARSPTGRTTGAATRRTFSTRRRSIPKPTGAARRSSRTASASPRAGWTSTGAS